MPRSAGTEHGWRQEYADLMQRAEASFSEAMSGHTLNLPLFEKYMPQAVAAGHVSQRDADFVLDGITHGFDLGVDESKLPGKVVFRNYKSAYENKATVSDALRKRVLDGKTLKLGQFDGKPADLPGDKGRVVANGAVPKKLEPDKVRPYSDHTKSRFNAACDLSNVEHTLDTYNEIACALRPGYSMGVEDVDGAFPCLPLRPRVWKYMYVWWFDVDQPLESQDKPNTLYVHVFGDFGTAPLPGIWDAFFRCVKGIARVAGALTLPMPHFVDDSSIIGPDEASVNAVAAKVSDLMRELGCPLKELKSRPAATLQLVLGFWWDSVSRTRALEQTKLDAYLETLRSTLASRCVTLQELQVLSGRMQRASLTLPQNSNAYLAEVLRLQRGLKLPWHKRRVTSALRRDISSLIYLLETNHGSGYFDTTHLPLAPPVYTDAATDRHRSGGGYFTADGYYNSWLYGSSMRRRPIVELEADAVHRAACELAPLWEGRRVPVFIDNAAFFFALKKGRSAVPYMDAVIRSLHLLGIQHNFVLVPEWIPTDSNVFADALSRGEFQQFSKICNQLSSGDIDLYRRCHSRPP